MGLTAPVASGSYLSDSERYKQTGPGAGRNPESRDPPNGDVQTVVKPTLGENSGSAASGSFIPA